MPIPQPATPTWSGADVADLCKEEPGEGAEWGGTLVLAPAEAPAGQWVTAHAVSLDRAGQPLCRWGTAVHGLLTSADSRRRLWTDEVGPGVTRLRFRALEPGDYELVVRTAHVDWAGLAVGGGEAIGKGVLMPARAACKAHFEPTRRAVRVTDTPAAAAMRAQRGRTECGARPLAAGPQRGQTQWRKVGSCGSRDDDRVCTGAGGAAPLQPWTFVPDWCHVRQYSRDELWAALDGRWIVGEAGSSVTTDNFNALLAQLDPFEARQHGRGEPVPGAGQRRDLDAVVQRADGPQSFQLTNIWTGGPKVEDNGKGFASYTEPKFRERWARAYSGRGQGTPDLVLVSGVLHDALKLDYRHYRGLDALAALEADLDRMLQLRADTPASTARAVWRTPPSVAGDRCQVPHRPGMYCKPGLTMGCSASSDQKLDLLDAVVTRKLCASGLPFFYVDFADLTYPMHDSPRTKENGPHYVADEVVGRAVVDYVIMAQLG